MLKNVQKLSGAKILNKDAQKTINGRLFGICPSPGEPCFGPPLVPCLGGVITPVCMSGVWTPADML